MSKSKKNNEEMQEEVKIQTYSPEYTPVMEQLMIGLVSLSAEVRSGIYYCIYHKDEIGTISPFGKSMFHVKYITPDGGTELSIEEIAKQTFTNILQEINKSIGKQVMVEEIDKLPLYFTEVYDDDTDAMKYVRHPFSCVIDTDAENEQEEAIKFMCIVYGLFALDTYLLSKTPSCTILQGATTDGLSDIGYVIPPIIMEDYDSWQFSGRMIEADGFNVAWQLFISCSAFIVANGKLVYSPQNRSDDKKLELCIYEVMIAMINITNSEFIQPDALMTNGGLRRDQVYELKQYVDQLIKLVVDSVDSIVSTVNEINYILDTDRIYSIAQSILFAYMMPHRLVQWLGPVTNVSAHCDVTDPMNLGSEYSGLSEKLIASVSIVQYTTLVMIAKKSSAYDILSIVRPLVSKLCSNGNICGIIERYVWETICFTIASIKRSSSRIGAIGWFFDKRKHRPLATLYTKLQSYRMTDALTVSSIDIPPVTNTYYFLMPERLCDLIEFLDDDDAIRYPKDLLHFIGYAYPSIMVYEILSILGFETGILLSEQEIIDLAEFINIAELSPSNILTKIAVVVSGGVPKTVLGEYGLMSLNKSQIAPDYGVYIMHACGEHNSSTHLYIRMLIWLSKTSLVNASKVVNSMITAISNGRRLNLNDIMSNYEVTQLLNRDATVTIP